MKRTLSILIQLLQQCSKSCKSMGIAQSSKADQQQPQQKLCYQIILHTCQSCCG